MSDRTGAASSRTDDERPLRVEMVLAKLYVGGMEIMVRNLMRVLRDRGHDVGLTCIEKEGSLFESVAEEGFRTRLIRTLGSLHMISPRPLTAWFQELRPDVVHVHSGAWIKGAVGARHADVSRIVYTHHGLEQRENVLDGLLNRYAARFTDDMVAVSMELRDRMRSEGGLRTHQIAVVPNGIPTERFTPNGPHAGLRTQFGIPDDVRIIGNVARMWPIKNHVGLIDAFALLHQRHTDTCLILVGDGELRSEIEERVRAHGLEERVFFTGEMSDVASVYREFDIFALSSFSEGLSISILEAMASAVCVVATDVGGNRELLDDGACGRLVTDQQPDTMARSLSEVLNDTAQRARLASAARTRVVDRFSVEAMGDQYERLYRGAGVSAEPHSLLNRNEPECVG